MNQVTTLQNYIAESDSIVGFTGAGVSTESGIADYRSQGGIWEKFEPVYIDEFIANEEKRKLYWQRKTAMWSSLKNAKPGIAHKFFTTLHDRGKLKGLITQNIDGLHEKSGLPAEKIVNLHGTSLEITCLDCHEITPANEIMNKLEGKLGSDHDFLRCQECGGLLKPNTISFGQSLDEEMLYQAEQLAKSCDLFIAAGSTLVVTPAASFPLIAKQHGARLVIITLSETPLDRFADLVINEPLGPFLENIEN